jgi:hypothetical protein
VWAKKGLFYPVPDPGFRQLKAPDPQAGRVDYKKANKSGAVHSLSKIMMLLCSTFL